jgi:hypothetical protein
MQFGVYISEIDETKTSFKLIFFLFAEQYSSRMAEISFFIFYKGKKIHVIVDDSMSILDFRKVVEKETGIHPNEQKLTASGKVLKREDDERSLKEVNITSRTKMMVIGEKAAEVEQIKHLKLDVITV